MGYLEQNIPYSCQTPRWIFGGVRYWRYCFHPELTIANEKIAGDLLLFTVLDNLINFINQCGSVSLKAHYELKNIK